MFYVSDLYCKVDDRIVGLRTHRSLSNFLETIPIFKCSQTSLTALQDRLEDWKSKGKTVQRFCDLLQFLNDMGRTLYAVVFDTVDLSSDTVQLGVNSKWLFDLGIMGFDKTSCDISIFDEVAYIQNKKNILHTADKVSVKAGNSGEALLMGMTSADKVIRIPMGIESILDRAFEKCNKAKVIYIPNTVKKHYRIKNHGGYGSTHMLRFTACDGSIYKYVPNAFGRITRKFSVYFDDRMVTAPMYLLTGAYKLTTVHLPYDLESIEECCFAFCKGLCSVDLTASPKLNDIGTNAFVCCENLSEIIVPDSVAYINAGAFAYCVRLVKAVLSDNVNLRDGVFKQCRALEKVQLPANMEKLPSETFRGCLALQHIDLPSNLQVIGSCAFDHCNRLSSVNIPETVTKIAAYAFSWCSSLKELVIPKGVTFIDSNAFSVCHSLKKVVFSDRDEAINHSFKFRGWFADSIIEQLIFESESKVELNTAVLGGSPKIDTLILKADNQQFVDCFSELQRVRKIYCYEGTLTDATLKQYGIPHDYIDR